MRARMANALLLQADVTANSADDKALLKRFGLFGPPGVVFFDAHDQEHADARVVGFLPPQRFAAHGGAVTGRAAPTPIEPDGRCPKLSIGSP